MYCIVAKTCQKDKYCCITRAGSKISGMGSHKCSILKGHVFTIFPSISTVSGSPKKVVGLWRGWSGWGELERGGRG